MFCCECWFYGVSELISAWQENHIIGWVWFYAEPLSLLAMITFYGYFRRNFGFVSLIGSWQYYNLFHFYFSTIKDLNRQRDAIEKTGIVVNGRCFKVKFPGYLCVPILTLYIFFILLFFIFAMFLCYMSSYVIVIIESILCLAVLENIWESITFEIFGVAILTSTSCYLLVFFHDSYSWLQNTDNAAQAKSWWCQKKYQWTLQARIGHRMLCILQSY